MLCKVFVSSNLSFAVIERSDMYHSFTRSHSLRSQLQALETARRRLSSSTALVTHHNTRSTRHRLPLSGLLMQLLDLPPELLHEIAGASSTEPNMPTRLADASSCGSTQDKSEMGTMSTKSKKICGASRLPVVPYMTSPTRFSTTSSHSRVPPLSLVSTVPTEAG